MKTNGCTHRFLPAVLSCFLTIAISSGGGNERTVSFKEAMDILHEKDSRIDDFVADVHVRVHAMGKPQIVDELTGRKFYQKPDRSLVVLQSKQTGQQYVFAEMDTLLKTRSAAGIAVEHLRDSYFLHDMRAMLRLFAGAGSTFSGHQTATDLYIIHCRNGSEGARMVVDLRSGEMVQRDVYNLPDSGFVSHEEYSAFRTFHGGSLPTRVIYEYKGLRTELELQYRCVNPGLPIAVFETMDWGTITSCER